MIPCKRHFLTRNLNFFTLFVQVSKTIKKNPEIGHISIDLEGNMMTKKDGHVHTPFCPHGTKDTLDMYIEQAIKEGFTDLTFTEHAPLPKGFIDPTPMRDSAMDYSLMEAYIQSVQKSKDEYKNDIQIHIGLEIDYIKDYEQEITDFLNEYGKFLDDSILSVHFLKINDKFFCMDFDEKTFGLMIHEAGSLYTLHSIYYTEVLQSIYSQLGVYKPKRIGHITLVNKFQKLYPATFSNLNMIEKILSSVKEQNLELDYNVAGLRKEYCGETYPNSEIITLAQKQKIPLIYGSDAHSARDVGKNYTHYDLLSNRD